VSIKKKHGVAVALIGAQHVAQLLRHRDGDVEVGARQKFRLTRSNPAFSLVTVASRAAPVLARVVGEDLGTAMVAAPKVPAELFGPAGENVGDGVAVRGQHRRAVGRQIAFREAAEDIRESDHDRPQLSDGGSEIGHQRVEGGLERGSRWLGEMGIDSGRCNVDVAEQNLHHARIGALLEQPCCIAMMQAVRADAPRDAGGTNGKTESPP
jgi:hypothetical protein